MTEISRAAGLGLLTISDVERLDTAETPILKDGNKESIPTETTIEHAGEVHEPVDYRPVSPLVKVSPSGNHMSGLSVAPTEKVLGHIDAVARLLVGDASVDRAKSTPIAQPDWAGPPPFIRPSFLEVPPPPPRKSLYLF